MSRLDREKARNVLREQFSEARPIALDVALDALEACVVPDPPTTIDRGDVAQVLVEVKHEGLSVFAGTDRILALAQPTGIKLEASE